LEIHIEYFGAGGAWDDNADKEDNGHDDGGDGDDDDVDESLIVSLGFTGFRY
jgi:hypothetical protein